MITNLHIKNIGIINDITIDFQKGFNVITGETGSGKTLIIESLGLLSGDKFSKELIRSGEKEAIVEAKIIMNKTLEMLVVSRSISSTGKSICKINNETVKLSDYRDFMKKIIDIHAQNDNQNILDINTHIEFIDSYSSERLIDLKQKYTNLYEEYQYINSELSRNYGDDKEKQRTLDLLNYQVNEIENANLKEGEEEQLEERRDMIMASEKIVASLSEAENQINNNIIDSLQSTIHHLEKIEKYNEKYGKLAEIIRSTFYDLEEVGISISDMNRELDFDEKEQNDIEVRLDQIKSLKRKYGNDIAEILEYKDKVSQEIHDIENLDGYIKELKEKKKELTKLMIELCKKMHEIRIQNATDLSQNINIELQELEMMNAKFSVQVELLDDLKFNKNGLDRVEFMISTNTGEQEKSLIKIASGGEMSRIMLAIKSVLSRIDKIPVIVFDEIDTGISGVAANSTGDKMKKISKSHQVICVTHLAPIAAKGEFNFYVSKYVENNKTKTTVKRLEEQEVIKEIARISSGNITETALNHAKELRNTKCA